MERFDTTQVTEINDISHEHDSWTLTVPEDQTESGEYQMKFEHRSMRVLAPLFIKRQFGHGEKGSAKKSMQINAQQEPTLIPKWDEESGERPG